MNGRILIRALPLLLLGVATQWIETRAHVALTFPRSRKYDLDFLDNSRTPGPCGMPRGEFTYHHLHTIYFSTLNKFNQNENILSTNHISIINYVLLNTH